VDLTITTQFYLAHNLDSWDSGHDHVPHHIPRGQHASHPHLLRRHPDGGDEVNPDGERWSLHYFREKSSVKYWTTILALLVFIKRNIDWNIIVKICEFFTHSNSKI
jgi:hypothetical protein